MDLSNSTTSPNLIYTQMPLIDWQGSNQDVPIFILAEAVINPLVRSLADRVQNESGIDHEENSLFGGEAAKTHASITPYLLRLKDWQSFADNIAFQPNCWSDENLSSFLLRNIERANQHKFTTEIDIVRYLSLTLVLGENFTEIPWAKEQLKKPAAIGTQPRMDILYQRAIEELE